MSLKSTRKRLKEYNDLARHQTMPKEKHKSKLSQLGVNPESVLSKEKDLNPSVVIVKKDKKENVVKENYIDKTKKEIAKKNAYKIYIDKSKNKIKDLIKFSNTKENINLLEKKKNAKGTKKPILYIIMAIVEMLTLVCIFGLGTMVRLANTTQVVPYEPENVKSPDVDVRTLETMKGYRTIAVFGLDSRTGSVGKGNNADVNMIVNVDLGTGAVQLVSVYRDLYLNVTDGNRYGKFNSAYFYGGPEGAVKALNKNFDLNITNYVSFNWKAVADGIDLLGGIDLEVKKNEYRYMNSFIHETCVATGINGDNPAMNYIKSAGMQHLNGVQSVAYARLRLMDSDFQRVERQKRVIALCLEKAKTLDFNMILGIAYSIIPTIAYDFDWAELTSLIKSIDGIHIVDSMGFPSNKHFKQEVMGNSGDCVIPYTLEKAVIELHNVLYADETYEPSKSVKSYSNTILELKRKYEEENKIKESEKALEQEANNEEDVVKPIINKSTKSNTKKNNATVPILSDNPLDIESKNVTIPMVEDGLNVYEEEPENDTLDIPNVAISNGNNVIISDAPSENNMINNQMGSTYQSNIPINPQTMPQSNVMTDIPKNASNDPLDIQSHIPDAPMGNNLNNNLNNIVPQNNITIPGNGGVPQNSNAPVTSPINEGPPVAIDIGPPIG